MKNIKKLNENGAVMAEVVIALGLLVIMAGLFYGIFSFCTNISDNTIELSKQYDTFLKHYYSDDKEKYGIDQEISEIKLKIDSEIDSNGISQEPGNVISFSDGVIKSFYDNETGITLFYFDNKRLDYE